MEYLLDLADSLAAQCDTPPRPDFPLSGELSRLALPSSAEEWLVRRECASKDNNNYAIKGMGYFAHKTIPAGTFLIVAKPLATAMDWEEDCDDDEGDGDDDQDLEEEEDKGMEPKLNSMIVLQLLGELKVKPELWTNVLAELFPRTADELARLPTFCCRDDKIEALRTSHLQEIERQPSHPLSSKVDEIAVRLPLIVRYNVLSIETCPELLSHPGPEGHANLGGVGLYHLPSFFNHSARPNCTRYAVGDVMFFVSNQDIKEGDEACICYIEHDVLCESAYRRNLMLQMDFEEDENTNDNNDTTALEEDGPDLPVVDSEVQNELMAMDSFERLQAIEELLQQAHGTSPSQADESNDKEEDADMEEDAAMDTTESGWFLCDVHNLRILKAITLDGLGQTAEALKIWEECVEFTEKNLPPLDENSIVMGVQAALCSLHMAGGSAYGSKEYIKRANDHADKALDAHNKLFGGGAARLRRRFKNDFQLSLRSSAGGSSTVASGKDAIDLLWPLTAQGAT